MKVLVATERGQGTKPDDYSWTAEGELVRLDDCPDRYCRWTGFSGVESHRATSTALVVEREDLTPELLATSSNATGSRAAGASTSRVRSCASSPWKTCSR